MNILQQILAGLRGEQSVARNLIHRCEKQGKCVAVETIAKFEALVKSGSHVRLYIGQPADWTYVPRSADFSGTSQDSPELSTLKNTLK